MADISKLEQQANLLMNNVSGWEQNVLTRIGKRICRYGKMSLADVKSINNIAVVKQDMDAIKKELAKVTGYNISQIEQMYGELLEEQHLANQPLYDYRGKKRIDALDHTTEKCGSCEWAMPIKGTINGVYVSYIECQNPEKVWNHNSSRRKKRTTPKCRFWQPKKKGGEG